MAAPGEEAPCGLCGAAAAPYTCPRCNRRLCSLSCYRGHGGCAEAFYREQVLQALEAERDTPPSRHRLDSAFHRLQQLREAEDSSGCVGRDLWESLSPAEQAGFHRLLNSGEAAKLLPPWRPWWWRRDRPKPAVEPPKSREEEEETSVGPAPPFPAIIPPLSSLPAPPPSPLLPFQLPNVLYAYAFALSLHGGDETLLPELPAAAIDVSAALRSRRPFSSTAEALGVARYDAETAGYPRCPLGDAGTVLAVAQLLEGRDGEGNADVVIALGHLEGLLRKGKRDVEEEERRRFVKARRKCRYLLAWSWETTTAATLARLAGEARRVHAAMTEAELVSSGVNGVRGSREKKLIEELD
ncbi:zinc finger HIT domain-containing protein 2 [Grus americana]|uniref:zinc finger HIT domain-containing protein 2 n=1 Tax=Grus americana TaxID=9117 RepID=UPI0024082B8F|nr:zinc finger HIT domain-containing protein 2 [Grus americana]